MPILKVKLKERGYEIAIAADLLKAAGEMSRRAVGDKARQAVIVSNPTVDALYGKTVEASYKRAGFRVKRLPIGDGERFKNLRIAESLYKFLIEQRLERSDILVALGGGVIGDLAGFVAATYLRGVRFVQIPTTLLAQIDSSVGGKTAVNHPLGKNLIGVFHQPSLVLIDIETLRSLPPRQLRAGLQEALKYGVIKDRKLFHKISEQLPEIEAGEAVALTELIQRCCEIKARVVERDEREGGLRRILNFGHTVGHALEAVTHYRRFLHGEAVGHGMRAASRIAETAGLLSANERQAIDEAVCRIGRLPQTKTLAIADIMEAMERDKKAEGGRIAFVLPVAIGRVIIKADLPLPLIRSAIKETLL